MRPHIRSSTEYRRRSIAAGSDLSKHELLRRKSLTSTSASPSSLSPNTDSVSRQPFLSRNNSGSFFCPTERISEVSSETASGSRRESLTGGAGGGRRYSVAHEGIQRRESAPVFGPYSSRSSASCTTRTSSLDANSYDVNTRRIVVFSVFCIIMFIVLGVGAWFYKYSRSPVWA